MESKNDYDSPWKEIIETWFQEFMEFFFPDAAAAIDWERGYEFLDKEFQQIAREAEQGRKLADKLAKVWLLDGQEVLPMLRCRVPGNLTFPNGCMFIITGYLTALTDRLSAWLCSQTAIKNGGLIPLQWRCWAARPVSSL